MNNTNRALNRIVLLLVGLILLAAGAAVAVGALWPGVLETVSSASSNAAEPVSAALGGDQLWILWVVAVASLVLIVVLAWFALRQGHGSTSTLLQLDEGSGQGSPTGGRVVVDAKVAEQVLEEALSQNPGLAAVDVTAFDVRGTTVLRISSDARRGVSPVDIRRSVDDTVKKWDELLGTQIPVVIEINGGLRTRLASPTRLA
ncbi:hypothetical protein [Marisediminicola sp. LYQ134]|uniref:hypothetical protein n=1 Tax=unclassified Marisediminicola TaxID=2618316 RepID=UPI0039835A60